MNTCMQQYSERFKVGGGLAPKTIPYKITRNLEESVRAHLCTQGPGTRDAVRQVTYTRYLVGFLCAFVSDHACTHGCLLFGDVEKVWIRGVTLHSLLELCAYSDERTISSAHTLAPSGSCHWQQTATVRVHRGRIVHRCGDGGVDCTK